MSVLYPNKVERNTIEKPVNPKRNDCRRMAQLICAIGTCQKFCVCHKESEHTTFSSHSSRPQYNLAVKNNKSRSIFVPSFF